MPYYEVSCDWCGYVNSGGRRYCARCGSELSIYVLKKNEETCCMRCGKPFSCCRCRMGENKETFDVSFQAYPIEVTYDVVKKEDESTSSIPDSQETTTLSHPDELFHCIEDTIKLTDLYFDNKGKEKEEELNKKINKYRAFYLINDKCWTISLKNKDLFKRYKNDSKFIGNKFKEILEDDNDMALMVQLVNERFELKAIGKYLFYREIYLHTYKNDSIKKLFISYVGDDEEQFLFEERENVHFYRWKFNVHRNRLVYVSELLKNNFNVSLDVIKTIKSYDDVLKYFLKH
jgi:hypothetical protein